VSEVLKREDLSVDVEFDVVVFRVADHLARFSYPTAFMIAQRLRLSAGVAARVAGVTQEERRDMKRQDAPHELNAGVQITNLSNGKPELRWDAWPEGALVAFQFGNTTARWEADKAMIVAAWFREGGRQAKHNAGDTSQTIRVAGILTDANENARLARR